MKRPPALAAFGKALVLVGLSHLALGTQAGAHAFIDRTDPLVGSTSKEVPREVNLWFTEDLEAVFSYVKVFDAAGREVDQKNVRVDAKNPKHLSVSLLRPLGADIYKVVWRAVSVDTHITEGSFTFTVQP